MDYVYVIYFDDGMYKNRSHKNAYLEERYAKCVITQEVKRIAENMYEEEIGQYWYSVPEVVKQEYIDKVRERFEVRKFVEENNERN